MAKPHPASDPEETLHVPCQICRQPVRVVVPGEDNILRPEIERVARTMATHDRCREKAKEAKIAKALEVQEMQKLVDWEGICPAEFRKKIDPHRRGYNGARFDRIMAWPFGEAGLFVLGKTGLCKTRFCYKLLEREHRAGKTVAGYMHADLRRMITAFAAGDSGQLERFISALVRLDVLLIDDLGKGRKTPTSEEAIFSIVDGRAKECRPILYTSNISREDFALQFESQFQAPVLRRITEHTHFVHFR